MLLSIFYRRLQEIGNRLFWLEGISDEYLEKIYDAATCLIAASEGEGFGLPLIKVAQHKLPIIARDIPVFREVWQGIMPFTSAVWSPRHWQTLSRNGLRFTKKTTTQNLMTCPG